MLGEETKQGRLWGVPRDEGKLSSLTLLNSLSLSPFSGTDPFFCFKDAELFGLNKSSCNDSTLLENVSLSSLLLSFALHEPTLSFDLSLAFLIFFVIGGNSTHDRDGAMY